MKRPKAPPVETRRDTWVLECNGRILVEYRDKGLLGGLWGFPEREPEEAFEARSGVRPLVGRERLAGRVDHVFTHRRWRMDVYVCEAARVSGEGSGSGDCPKPSGNFRWVTEEEFAALPVSKAFQKVWECARRTPTGRENAET